MEQRTIFAPIERCIIERIVRRLRRIVVKSKIEEMLAVGKEKWPAMRSVLSRVDLRDGSWCSSAGTDAHQGCLRGRREQDHAARSPGPPAPKLGVADRLHRASIQVDRLQLTIGEKSKRAAVG